MRALLAYLAMEPNRPHSREVLAGILWPEQSQRSAMDNLRSAIADLRRVLLDSADDHHFLIVSRDRIQMNPACDFWLDVIEFERLSLEKTGEDRGFSSETLPGLLEAVKLYKGGFLEGFTVARSAPFEEWMMNRRDHLMNVMMDYLQFIADHYERWGELQLAFEAAWKQVELEPWREEAHQQIMRLYAYDGKRSSALQQYKICQKNLASELGVEPSGQTRRLFESIRDGTLFMPYHFKRPHPPARISSREQRSSPFFAREEELQLLEKHIQDCMRGESRVLFVMGEAGSGKTTLIREFIRRSMKEYPGLIASYTNCNAFTGNSDPFLPFVEILCMLTGDVAKAWSMGAEDQEIAARLWSAAPEAIQALGESGPHLIGRLVAGEALLARARALPHVSTDRLDKIVQTASSSFVQTLPGFGGIQYSALFDQILNVFNRIAQEHPLILALDDLQWADADTINLLFYMCRRMGKARMMILGMFREEELSINPDGKNAPLLSVLHELQSSHTCACINLSQADGSRFIQGLVDSEPNRLGIEFRTRLERATGGLPLFSIELLRTMQARGDLVRNEYGQWVEALQINWEHLPPQVEAVIAEQVNRLPITWQTILEVASIEGDEFTAETIAKVLSLDSQEVSQQLSSLISRHNRMLNTSGVQHLRGQEGRLSHYRFRHHLFQKYFYNRQDIVQRARRHEAVGYAMETLFGEHIGDFVLSLAHHFEQAGLPEKAAEYLLRAGNKALPLFAYERAITLYQNGLVLVSESTPSENRDHLELHLLAALSGAFITTEGYTSSNLNQLFVRARKLINKIKYDPDIFKILALLKSYYNIYGDPKYSREIADQILKMAKVSKNSSQLVLAHSRMVANCLYYAQWEKLQKHLKETVRLYDAEKHQEIMHQVGSNPKANALSFGALCFWIIGYPEKAYLYCKTALDLAQDLAHPIVSWFAYYYAAYLFSYTGDTQQVSKYVEKMLRICEEQELDYYLTYSRIWKDWLLANAPGINDQNLLSRDINRLRQTGDRMNLLIFLRLQVVAYLNCLLLPQALNVMNEALELCDTTQIIYEKPELLRLKGEILLAQFPDDLLQAEEWFLGAIECAVQQKSKMWELRSTINLALLWQKQGKENDAHRKLMEIYSWFSEGCDSQDLNRARLLLGELNKAN